MKRFIDRTLKPALIIGGLGTAAAGLYAFWPQFAVTNVADLEFVQDYTIFVQHWGIMVGLMGVMMVAAAFKPSWVLPILVYSTLEKLFMVYLTVSNSSHSYSGGFYAAATMDGIIVLYSLLYFWSLRER
jgi:hypothetical protein